MMNFLFISLLALLPFLAFPADKKEDFNHTYYPKLDFDSAYELHTIKRNYYRYGDKLKILADARIEQINSNDTKINDK
ncbi:hypothetical protein IC220_05160 [Wolbachia endosymbiont of Pentalonia nigronervosa]|jgi:hypothetical protein|uniref:hypothetical protein n=1 Tax=Wolbachia endosymbiont of Pentalonia nigronervosa TaxID=1301914 RepID=UPI00165FE9A5|nr:hypothetical protein [Wolbachia endosymbiont of Pentalonia nigronervosa]MBD0391825.1 hypothetical protein [Wolbachia endosymbiont of Pentalonia nigronervosa]